MRVTDQAGVPVFAFPALVPGSAGVSLRLLRSADEAAKTTRRGLAQLFELQLRYELAWLEKDLRDFRSLGALTATLAPVEQLQADAFYSLQRWLADPGRVDGTSGESEKRGEVRNDEGAARILTVAAFGQAIETARSDLRGLVPRVLDLVKDILNLRQTLLVHPQPYPGLQDDLNRLLPADFLRSTPYKQWIHLPRYLKAMRLRADRWRQNPAKDAERAKLLAPYLAALSKVSKQAASRPGNSRLSGNADSGSSEPSAAPTVEAFRWLVEEYRVSLFAQELGTAEPVSATKLDRALAAVQTGKNVEEVSAKTPASPRVQAPAPGPVPTPTPLQPPSTPSGKKPAPIKDLNALASLFRKP